MHCQIFQISPIFDFLLQSSQQGGIYLVIVGPNDSLLSFTLAVQCPLETVAQLASHCAGNRIKPVARQEHIFMPEGFACFRLDADMDEQTLISISSECHDRDIFRVAKPG